MPCCGDFFAIQNNEFYVESIWIASVCPWKFLITFTDSTLWMVAKRKLLPYFFFPKEHVPGCMFLMESSKVESTQHTCSFHGIPSDFSKSITEKVCIWHFLKLEGYRGLTMGIKFKPKKKSIWHGIILWILCVGEKSTPPPKKNCTDNHLR